MNEQKKTFSATEKKDKAALKIIVQEAYSGTKPLPEILMKLALSEYRGKKIN